MIGLYANKVESGRANHIWSSNFILPVSTSRREIRNVGFYAVFISKKDFTESQHSVCFPHFGKECFPKNGEGVFMSSVVKHTSNF